MPTLIAILSLTIWVYLLLARGGFWLARERDEAEPCEGPSDSAHPPAGMEGGWPNVAAVIPARNEAKFIQQAVTSLLRQDYPGRLHVIVVDDHSDDGTAEHARAAANNLGMNGRLDVLPGVPLPAGWTGKLWAVRQGISHACGDAATSRLDGTRPPQFLLLTDADICHAPDNVRRLVIRACTDDRVLVSLMAKLRSDTLAERAMIPAFVLFFQMLYPFAWVNRREGQFAAAAGGCMLVRRSALEAIGGIESIRAEIIDDCALAAQLKTRGSIWVGLTERAISIRAYPRFGDIRDMIARTAYAQLRYSPLWLAGTLASLSLTFIAPPLLALFAQGWASAVGALAWLAIALAYQPMLRFYRRSAWWGPLLPGIAVIYSAFTLDSAIQHWRGRGGMWKGRAQARP